MDILKYWGISASHGGKGILGGGHSLSKGVAGGKSLETSMSASFTRSSRTALLSLCIPFPSFFLPSRMGWGVLGQAWGFQEDRQ